MRLMTADDIDKAREVQVSSFSDYGRQHGEEIPTEVPADAIERQRGRFRHFVTNDPEGSWVAEVDGVVVGTALALRRESLWGLSLLAVEPSYQSHGVGRRLLDATLGYADGVATAVILSSEDPRAMRAYAVAGFDLHPQVEAKGAVDRALLPRLSRVVDADVSRAEWADDVDRLVRGAARGPDHGLMNAQGQMYVVDDVDGRGYCYVRFDGRLVTVAATDDETATELLWRYLACDRPGEHGIDHITAGQQWAVQVALAARMRLSPAGPVYWRGRQPPPSYLPDGAYL